jgi:hypothetical protein
MNNHNKHQEYTISDVFCDTYIEMDPNPRRGGYISLAVILKDKYYHEDPNRLFVKNACPDVFERDGFPVHRVRTRFCIGLRKCGNSVCRLYNTLNQVFTEQAIKTLFQIPNVWLMNHNYLAKKRRAAEFNEENRLKKLSSKSDRKLHIGCVKATANRSATAHARYIRSLQFK